jgi:hypothetical protein
VLPNPCFSHSRLREPIPNVTEDDEEEYEDDFESDEEEK